VRGHLLSDENKDREWVTRGTEPEQANFALFNIEESGVKFTFSEYQIDCYAAGEQELFVGYHEMKNIMNPSVYQAVVARNL